MAQLSNETLNILKNFSNINPNLVVKKGNTLSTISEAKNILASATISEDFDTDFGIYDLNEFINVVNLVGDPQLDFKDDHVVLQNGKTQATYRFADANILTSPQSEITMPDADVTVTITDEQLNQIRKAAGTLGHNIVSLSSSGESIILSIVDPKNSSANTFSITLDEKNESVLEEFDFQFLISNLKVINGDYTVKISSKLISQWINKTADVKYYIALEKTSTYNNN